MYSLNYTYLTELEVDTRQSYDDLSDDLLLLDKDYGEESQTVDMKSVVSSWQNFFWQFDNNYENKKRLDITFTDLIIDHSSSTKDHFGYDLDEHEMMTVEELDSFFDGITTWGQASNRDWDDFKEALCDVIEALHTKYRDTNNVCPVGSMVVSTTNPKTSSGFGSTTWRAKTDCYIGEIFNKAYYKVNPGYNEGSGGINDIGLKATASNPPTHTHQLEFIPATGNGSGSTSSEVSIGFQWYNQRQGKDKSKINIDYVGGWQLIETYSGGVNGGHTDYWFTPVVKSDVTAYIPGNDGERSANFSVSNTKVDPVDSKIKVAPKTYPLSAAVWERTA